MTSERIPAGPDPEALIKLIRETWPETDLATMNGAAFFSIDAEKHWPNFATIVWNDDFDQASNLTRAGVFRLNMGVGRTTFDKLVGEVADPDYHRGGLDLASPRVRETALDLDSEPKRRDHAGRRDAVAHRSARPPRGPTRQESPSTIGRTRRR